MATPTISDQIRQAIIHCGITRYRLSKLTGIDASTLSKFVAGKAGMSLANIDELGRVLKLEINHPRGKGKGKK